MSKLPDSRMKGYIPLDIFCLGVAVFTSEDDRLAIGCRYFLGLSEEETASALGWRRGTVKSRTSRALERLRQRLEEER